MGYLEALVFALESTEDEVRARLLELASRGESSSDTEGLPGK